MGIDIGKGGHGGGWSITADGYKRVREMRKIAISDSVCHKKGFPKSEQK